MPRIPVYEQRTAPSGLGPSPRATATPVVNVGAGTQELGRSLQNIATDMQRVQEQEREDDASIAASTALAEGKLFFAKRKQELSDAWKAPLAPVETEPVSITDTLDSEFKDWSDKQLNASGTPRVRRAMQERLAGMRSELLSDAMRVDREKRIDMNVGRFDRTVDASVELVSLDPAQREEVLDRLRTGLQDLAGIDDAKKADIASRVEARINLAAVNRNRALMGDTAFFRSIVRPKGEPSQVAPSEPAQAPSLPTDPTLPAGMRNNNPGNIKWAKQPDAVGPSKNLDQGSPQAVYASPESGAVAMFNLALKKFDGGKTTINDLIAGNGGWTPGNKQSAANIARMMGVKPDEPVNLRDSATLTRFGRALVTQEQGKRGAEYSDGLLSSAASSALSGKAAAQPQRMAPPVSGQTVTADGVEFVVKADHELPAEFRALPQETRFKLLQEAASGMEREVRESDRQARQVRAEQAAKLRDRVNDSSAMAVDGVVDPNPLRAGDFAPLGEDAPKAFDEYQRSQAMARDVNGMGALTNQELMGFASGASRRAVPGPGYASEDARDKVRANAAAVILEQREKDPSGYVARTAKSVQSAWAAAANPALDAEGRSAAVQAAVSQTLAAQESLGIDKPRQRILSSGMLQREQDRIMAATRPEDAANIIKSLEAEYGRYFPDVMNELARADKELPSAYMIIPSLSTPAAREMVSRLAVVPMAQMKIGIDSADVKAISESSTQYSSKFARTVPPVGVAGYRLIGAYDDMIQRIALEQLRTGRAKNANDAADAAYKVLLGQFSMDDTLRVPVGMDTGKVRDGLASRLQSQVPNSITVADVPTDQIGAYKPDEALRQWREIVAARGVWYTSSNNRNAELWAYGPNGVLYRVTGGGPDKQITVPLRDLIPVPAAARQPARQPAPVPWRGPQFGTRP